MSPDGLPLSWSSRASAGFLLVPKLVFAVPPNTVRIRRDQRCFGEHATPAVYSRGKCLPVFVLPTLVWPAYPNGDGRFLDNVDTLLPTADGPAKMLFHMKRALLLERSHLPPKRALLAQHPFDSTLEFSVASTSSSSSPPPSSPFLFSSANGPFCSLPIGPRSSRHTTFFSLAWNFHDLFTSSSVSVGRFLLFAATSRSAARSTLVDFPPDRLFYLAVPLFLLLPAVPLRPASLAGSLPSSLHPHLPVNPISPSPSARSPFSSPRFDRWRIRVFLSLQHVVRIHPLPVASSSAYTWSYLSLSLSLPLSIFLLVSNSILLRLGARSLSYTKSVPPVAGRQDCPREVRRHRRHRHGARAARQV